MCWQTRAFEGDRYKKESHRFAGQNEKGDSSKPLPRQLCINSSNISFFISCNIHPPKLKSLGF
jgi:hypothetical protein